MKKIRGYILKHLDQMICIGGSAVIVCATLKFIEAPGSDIIFCLSLLVEAFIFLLGAIKPGENLYKEEYCLRPQETKEWREKTEENVSDEKAFFLEIQEEIKKLNERINERIKGSSHNDTTPDSVELLKTLDLADLLKKIKTISEEVDRLTSQTKKIEEDFSSFKKKENEKTISEEQKETPHFLKRKRGRPRKNK